MTGFGRSEAETEGRKVTIEIKAVNHRYLDINIRSPRALSFSEEYLRKTIKDRLSRGRIDVFLNYSARVDDTRAAKADMGLINSYINAAREAGSAVGLSDNLSLSDVISIPDAIIIEEAASDENLQSTLVGKALTGALDMLEDMRVREGEELKENIIECLGELEKINRLIESKKEAVPKDYAEKLKSRIKELLEDTEVDETRFNTEVAFMADRIDITEEVVRLYTHINQFKSAAKEENSVGRKLDFMVQEMNRELNTMGSKSQDMEITNAVIEGKSVIEKIREQVQNIE
jgi:uncharacterized protein (TIGR00255 family)